MQLPPARAGYPLHVGQAERDEQQAGLVHVGVVAVHYDDVGGLRPVRPPQPVREQRPAGAATEDDDPFHTLSLGREHRHGQGRWSREPVAIFPDRCQRQASRISAAPMPAITGCRKKYRRRTSSSTAIHAIRSRPAR